ncbi:MAG: MmgE/PrpD family protein [Pirellulales bacterium]|nr:MmgE/PrpD family protein [Pirellulales bacterium]
MPLLESLARIAVETPPESITAEARAAARKLLLDTLGVSLAGWSAPGVRAVFEQMQEWGGQEDARLLVFGGRCPAPNAVFANSALAHALDFDDIHVPSSLHISCMVWPAVLAVGEITGASGRELLDAAVLGVETACRVGNFYDQRCSGVSGRGFLQTGVVGGFGVTGAACRLLDYDRDATLNALGLTYSQAGGNRQALLDKTLGKRIQPAFTARNALWAVELAGRGLSGPPRALEGAAGLFPVFIHAEPPTVEDLEKKHDYFEIERCTVKRFIGCGGSYPTTLAALELSKEYDLSREKIGRVGIYWPPDAFEPNGANLVGGRFKLGATPQVDAQFSAAYCAALALLRREIGLAQFTNEQILRDTEVLRLAEEVEILDAVQNPPPPGNILNDDYPPHIDKPHLLIVWTRDGRELRRVHTNRDVLDPKFTPWDVVLDKFRKCAEFSGICPPAQAEKIVEAVENVERSAGVADFYKACGLHDALVELEQTT